MKTKLVLTTALFGLSSLIFSCEKDQTITESPKAVSESETEISTSNALRSLKITATCGAQGWASQNGGTTGGGTSAETVVSTYAALKSAVQNSAVKVIRVTGTITIPAAGRILFQDQSGKTIYGAAGARLVSTDQTKDGSGILSIKRVNNLLIRNLIFEGPGAYDVDGWDLAVIDACKNVWVDHCEFRDGVDGNLDIKNTSDFVTVSWTKFNYLKAPRPGGPGGADDHRFSNLIGSSDSATADRGTLRVTFASCWWGPGCVERMPRVRFGRVHVINSLFNSSNASKCIMAGKEANILAENDVFENAKDAIYLVGGQTALQVKNCTFTNVSGNRTGVGTAFTPPYTVAPRSAASVKSSVTASTGAGATISGNVCTFSPI
ncbi:MAG: pectate lyase family protein [Emticicia sp.]|uniref:pectate lyase family protein n=1 Tax=Emticicia sp. TaxID=1930953 RepID=UPI003BA53F3B